MNKIYLNDWDNFDEMVNSFLNYNEKWEKEMPDERFDGIEVLLASYGQDNYCGAAFVLFKKNGILYEVNGSHCSCYGLEGQWEPEETTKEALLHRLASGFGQDNYSGNEFAAELREVLETL